jgi:hypothetical protein
MFNGLTKFRLEMKLRISLTPKTTQSSSILPYVCLTMCAAVIGYFLGSTERNLYRLNLKNVVLIEIKNGLCYKYEGIF